MRILHVSDLHYNLRQFDWVLAHAAGYDVVALSGDHLDIASPVPLEAQIVAVRTTLARLAGQVPVVACSGNHDLDGLNEAGEKTATWLGTLRPVGIGVDGDTRLLAGVRFTMLPWWDGPVSQRRTEAVLEGTPGNRDRPWVWVYHSPPEGPLSWTGSRHFGDPVIREWIDRWRPDVVLCGHIHQAPFVEGGSWAARVGPTWLFNPGAQAGPDPTRIEVDVGPDRAVARWFSLEGQDERLLPAGTESRRR